MNKEFQLEFHKRSLFMKKEFADFCYPFVQYEHNLLQFIIQPVFIFVNNSV